MASSAQTKKELEEKRAALDKQIRTTNTLLEQSRTEQTSAQKQLDLLNARIGQREQLIGTMTGEISRTDQSIRENEAVLKSLQEDLVHLKDDYANMVRAAYYNRGQYDRLSFLFSAESFAQAYKRSRYLGQIAEQRKRQAALILETQTTIQQKLDELKGQRTEKAKLVGDQIEEKKKLTADQGGQQATLGQLKKEEGRLKEQQRKQEQKRRDLDKKIRAAIDEEISKEAAKTPKDPKAPAGAKPSMSLSPEAKALGADFEKNKGKLPWPVERGVITEHFGRHPNPLIPSLVRDCSGTDFTTDKNATVRSVFKGEVTSVIVIPGAGKAVIVSHGAYRTVYTNLREVNVTKGQKVETKQAIGTVLTDEDGTTAHIEVWKITAEGPVKVDPEQWMAD